MERHEPREATARVLVLALLLWGAVVAAATLEGVFDALSQGEVTALALFATFYALATYRLDVRLRGHVLGRGTLELALAAAGFDVALALAFAWAAPRPLIAFFLMPLVLVAHLALAERVFTARGTLKPAAARSPGANQAAI